MPESIKTRLKRWMYNFYPVYRRTGSRITYIDDSWKEVRIALPLRIWTRNYYGTVSGISMFGAVDPIYMVMLIKLLGPDYEVWDKEASIYFKKPGKTKLTARFLLDDDELNSIRHTLETESSLVKTYYVDLIDETGTVCATVDKVIHIRKKVR
jgi:acyl-coenzyme A thioesterase PaaI-like protein